MKNRLLIAMAVIIACVFLGAIGGRIEANRNIQRTPNRISDPDRYRQEITAYGLSGGVLMGACLGIGVFLYLQFYRKQGK